jgi:hypothetical protein
VKSREALAVNVWCSDDALRVTLDDGRVVTVPLVWFPRLLGATRQQRKHWTLIGQGVGMHWEAIDEDISVASLLQPERCVRFIEATPLSPKNLPRKRARRGSSRRRASSRPS